MWQSAMVAVLHLLLLALVLFGLRRLHRYDLGQVRSRRRPLSDSTGGSRPIRGAASRLDRLVFDHSIDHSASDISRGDDWILSNSDS